MNPVAVQEKLGYRFSDETLLVAALTHPSYAAEHQQPHYQRLEFLGDAVLELAISRYLYDQMKTEQEGRLTRMRAALVCEDSLCEAARAYGLGEVLLLSPGEAKSGGRDKPSILADVMEAVIAAVYLDGGMEEAFALVYRALKDKLENGVDIDLLDAKTHLQEVLQKGNGMAPVYELVSVDGPAHKPSFTARVLVDGEPAGEGVGRSKQIAQQEAARAALRALKMKKRK